jgi:hypothetical protein
MKRPMLILDRIEQIKTQISNEISVMRERKLPDDARVARLNSLMDKPHPLSSVLTFIKCAPAELRTRAFDQGLAVMRWWSDGLTLLVKKRGYNSPIHTDELAKNVPSVDDVSNWQNAINRELVGIHLIEHLGT